MRYKKGKRYNKVRVYKTEHVTITYALQKTYLSK